MKWRKRLNTALGQLFGYRLVRHDAVPHVDATRAHHAADRLVEATKEAKAVHADLKKAVAAAPSTAGTAPTTKATKPTYPADFDSEIVEIITKVRPYTMTSPDKLHALISAARYVHAHDIPGAIVECGVWRGGSMHSVARTLDARGDHSRDLYLFDTYEGMPPPSDRDVRADGSTAADLLAKTSKSSLVWAVATLDDVRSGFEENISYPAEKIHYVVGKVEDTIPGEAPDQIAILRLDTDWYASTKHELEHLWDRLSPGGVLIIDDYGSWQGSREATDEWLAETGVPLLLMRAGRARVAVKPS